MKDILIPISPGELLDKISILRIKAERISDTIKVANVRIELNLLEQTWKNSGHHRSLRDESTVVPETEFKHERAGVTAAWNKSFGFIV